MKIHKPTCLQFLCSCKPEDRYDDTLTLCPYCGSQARGNGCCSESSAHFEEHYVKYERPRKCIGDYPPYNFVNPNNGEIHDEPNEETRVVA